MRKFSKCLLVATIGLLAPLAAAGTGQAITGGDADGNAHPNVGILVFYTAEGRFRCTGTLVTSTVVLTAAHCADGTLGKAIVSFDSEIAQSAPSGIPVAADPTKGYTKAPGVVNGKTWYAGTAYRSPAYSNFTDMDNWNDYAVVKLDKAISGIAPAKLAPLNYMNGFEQPALNKTLFDLVGYGTRIDKPAAGPQKPQALSFPLIRRATTAPGQKLTVQLIQMNGNINDTRGGGGTCFGDSGGPAFLNGYVVGVTSYGLTSNCRYIDGYQRVDIDVAQAFLASFGVYPAA